MTRFVYDHAGVRKIKSAASPTIYPNQYYTDFGGGAGNELKHIFLGETRILTKKARIAPDRQHWYYRPDHLGSTSIVTNENGQLTEHIHYFPYGIFDGNKSNALGLAQQKQEGSYEVVDIRHLDMHSSRIDLWKNGNSLSLASASELASKYDRSA